MKKGLFLLISLMFNILTFGQTESKYSTYYYQRATLFEQLPISSDDILFIGNSITDGGEWSELFQNPHIKNRGISGDTTWGVYDRISILLKGKPAQIFLMIGINNIPKGESPDSIAIGIQRIIQKIKKESPNTEILVQSLLPVTTKYNMFLEHTSRWELIPYINQAILRITKQENIKYIDLFSYFVNKDGQMKPEYTNDGLHLLGKGYILWKEIISPYLKIQSINKKS